MPARGRCKRRIRHWSRERQMTAITLRPLSEQPNQPTAACELPASPAAVPAARRLVSSALAAYDLTDTQIADAELIASELVTNALRHGTPPIRLRVRLQAGIGIVVSVFDAGGDLPK